jgi:hypothetical protein
MFAERLKKAQEQERLCLSQIKDIGQKLSAAEWREHDIARVGTFICQIFLYDPTCWSTTAAIHQFFPVERPALARRQGLRSTGAYVLFELLNLAGCEPASVLLAHRALFSPAALDCRKLAAAASASSQVS